MSKLLDCSLVRRYRAYASFSFSFGTIYNLVRIKDKPVLNRPIDRLRALSNLNSFETFECLTLFFFFFCGLRPFFAKQYGNMQAGMKGECLRRLCCGSSVVEDGK